MNGFRLYQIQVKPTGKGKLPDAIRHYLIDVPPMVGYSTNKDDAYIADEHEAKELKQLLGVKAEKV